jgi:hypothetical protein
MKTVKIGRFGQPLKEIAFADGENVNNALAAAGETLKKGETLTINGETVRGSYVFEDQDTIIIEASTTGA